MKFTMFRRDFSRLVVMPGLDFEIERYSKHALGGPKQATIQATGNREALFGLVNHLRAPVEILNDRGECVWWGYLARVDISWMAISYGVDLGSMFNQVAVAYTNQNYRYTTQWSGNADSIAEYGQKEILLSRSDVVAAEALALRDTYLAGSKSPIPVLGQSGGVLLTPTPDPSLKGGESGSVVLTCLGWFSTLDWRYYDNQSGKESYEITGRGGREIGEDDRPIFAQSFQLASSVGWTATSIYIRPWKQGDEDPTDNLVVSLKADSAGVPGTTLASGSVAASAIGDSSEWVEFVLNTGVALSPSTTYWVHIARSGGVSETAYFMVDTNLENGYTRGAPKYYNTNLSAWVDAAHKGDLIFIAAGDQSTSDQISVLVTACGEFLQGTIIESVSGVESNPYRNGDAPALYELEKLLMAGTSNYRRLLAEVSRNRYLRIYEEPARPSSARNSYAINMYGQILEKNLILIDQSLCPAGVWCHLQDVIPASVDLSMIADPSLFFVEEAEFDVAEGTYRILQTRDQGNVMDLGGVIQG